MNNHRFGSVLTYFGTLICMNIHGFLASAELTASPTIAQQVYVKVKNGFGCMENNDCISGSCFRLSMIGLCQCKLCSSDGCGGCSANYRCQVSENRYNFCQEITDESAYNAITRNLPSDPIYFPTYNPTDFPTYIPTYIPTSSSTNFPTYIPTRGSDVVTEESKEPSAQPTASHTVGEKLENKSKCSVDSNCLSGVCYRRGNQKIGLCQCKPCSTAGCGGCPTTKYCKIVEGKKTPRCDVYYLPSSGNATGMVQSKIPMKLSTEAPTVDPGESTGANATAGPTAGQKVENGRCLVNDDCLSGSCVQIQSNKRVCKCKICSTGGCSGCPTTKNCVVVENKKYPRCETYQPTSALNSTGPTVTVTEVPSGFLTETVVSNGFPIETVLPSGFPTEMPVEVTTVEPEEIETNSTVVVEPTLFPTVSVKLDIGEVCYRSNDCLSGSCHIRLNWKRQGKCHCKTCSSAGCGGCSSTKNCKTIHPLVPNMCFPYVPIPTEIPIPTKSPFSSPSNVPSYSPTASAKPVPACVRNSQCGEGHVCGTESRCEEVTCWRNSECSKFDAYCNEMEICEQKKDPSQLPSGSPSLEFTSLSPNGLSSAQKSGQSVLDLINDKTKNTMDLVNNRTKNTIEEVNVKAREAMSWYSDLPSNMRIGVFAITFAITLAVFATFAWIGTCLVRRSSQSQLKGVDETDDSSLDSIPFRRSNSFCVPAPESYRDQRSPSPSSVGSHKSNPYPVSRNNSFCVPPPEINFTLSPGAAGSPKSNHYSSSVTKSRSDGAGNQSRRSLKVRSGGSVKSQPSHGLIPLGMADDNGSTKSRASKTAGSSRQRSLPQSNNPKLASDISLSRPRTLPRTNSNESRYRRTDSNESRYTTSFQKPKSSVASKQEYYPASRSLSGNTSLARNRSAPATRNGKYRSPA